MDAGFLVLHDTADINVLAITQRVDIHLDGVVQEASISTGLYRATTASRI